MTEIESSSHQEEDLSNKELLIVRVSVSTRPLLDETKKLLHTKSLIVAVARTLPWVKFGILIARRGCSIAVIGPDGEQEYQISNDRLRKSLDYDPTSRFDQDTQLHD